MAIYTSTERFVTFLITGPTMFGIWPVLYALYRNNQMLPLWNGILTTLFSFMYHTLDSLDIEFLGVHVDEWHKMDLVWSIMTFINL